MGWDGPMYALHGKQLSIHILGIPAADFVAVGTDV